ncbi:MAG: threonine/serine dehydratase [Gemmatimonadetes bacterium]|nr:threonine/serine dehydratase [Gemmatimonadota bacterium]
MSDGLVELEAIQEAQERIRPVAVRTPLYPSDVLSRELGSDVRLKLESLQRTGSFKFRGAYNFVSQLPEDVRSKGVITYSSGNHAQAVALSAQLHDTRAVVVMPTTSPQLKRDGAERWGAEVVLEGTTSLERRAKAESIALERGLVMVPPFDHPSIIAGQGTVGLEIAEDWDAFDSVVVPIGGGGLCSGTAAALRRLRPGVRIFGVEPAGGAAMKAALDAGEPVTLDRSESIADGLLPVRISELTLAHVRELVDDVVLVDDDAIRSAASLLFKQQRLVVEFSGAATVAALRSGQVETEGRRVVAIISGGNVDPALLLDP